MKYVDNTEYVEKSVKKLCKMGMSRTVALFMATSFEDAEDEDYFSLDFKSVADVTLFMKIYTTAKDDNDKWIMFSMLTDLAYKLGVDTKEIEAFPGTIEIEFEPTLYEEDFGREHLFIILTRLFNIFKQFFDSAEENAKISKSLKIGN